MIALLGKLEALWQDWEHKAGPFAVFGLFEREDRSGRFHLIAAADWMRDETKERQFFKELPAALTDEELVRIELILAVPPDHEFIQSLAGLWIESGNIQVGESVLAVNGSFTVRDRWIELRDFELNEIPFRRAYVFAVRVPVQEAAAA
jgi:hypothetical protein